MKIYLAGPDVFKRDSTAIGAHLKNVCTIHGAEGLFPIDTDHRDMEPGTPVEAVYVRRSNLALIDCDAIIANLTPFRSPSLDVGTAYEMGVGAALQKIVIGYTEDPRSYVDRVKAQCNVKRDIDGQLRDDQDLAVEDFRDGGIGLVDNLMIACGIDGLCKTAEAAIISAIQAFRAREGKPALP